MGCNYEGDATAIVGSLLVATLCKQTVDSHQLEKLIIVILKLNIITIFLPAVAMSNP
jgi:hypothetical protein